MASIEDFINEWNSDSEYIVAHTSGSTGKPKEIRLPKADMRISARATNRRFAIGRHSVIAAPLSVDYIAGKMMVVRALEAGCRYVELPVGNDIDLPCHVDLLAVVPSQVGSLLDKPERLKYVGNLIVGGAPLSAEMKDRLTRSGVKAYATYGMTETYSHVALAPIVEGEYLYTAMPGITFELDDRGCLVIIAPQYSFGKLVTNDLAELRSPTSFVWLGRHDNIINSGGIKISVEQLEQELAQYLDVPYAVTRKKDSLWGEVPVIVIEGSVADAEKCLTLLRTEIDHKRCPKAAIAVDRLPIRPNGKIDRKALGDMAESIS